MARPRIFADILVSKSIRLTSSTWKEIRRVAKEQGLTSTAWIREALLKELEP